MFSTLHSTLLLLCPPRRGESRTVSRVTLFKVSLDRPQALSRTVPAFKRNALNFQQLAGGRGRGEEKIEAEQQIDSIVLGILQHVRKIVECHLV
jgi:hypothetical protein